MQKYVGLGIMLLCGQLMKAWWGDPVEGAYARPFFAVMILAGLWLVMLGLRDEVIDGVVRRMAAFDSEYRS